MDFRELHRWFAPVRNDEVLDPDVGALWGGKLHGWQDWAALRDCRRVILLAEAGSGKSEEFRNQARTLAAEGKPAFFVRIEELADQGFEAALGPGEARTFEAWRSGTADGYFFLDSIDEARLNRKSFETALKRFARETGEGLERGSVFISCRVSDWKGGEDRRAIMDWLPAHRKPATRPEADEHARLLAPLFDERQTTNRSGQEEQQAPHELRVVQLVPLDAEQTMALARAAGVNDSGAFATAITKEGLDALRQRPSDVLDLATYWAQHGKLGSYADMVDYAIERKLAERDRFRPDNAILPADEARQGAERLAAAMTFGKSFTARAPGADHDPSLTTGAIDPAAVLGEWTDAKGNTLLSRGVFSPATYGRVRFHHRASQEYLSARWLNRLLLAGCPKAELWLLIFAEPYGVATLVPSLRPASAWLALWHPDICDEIIAREPMVLLQFGDPRSLGIEIRKRLLTILAKKHAEGEVSDTNLDARNLAMFADPRLAADILVAWEANDRDEFRFMLLRLIRDGAIPGCEAILRDTVKGGGERNYNRLVALGAMAACDDRDGLEAAARAVMAAPAELSAYMAAESAEVIYPKYLTTAELLTLIAEGAPPRSDSTGGFAYEVASLYRAAPTARDRAELVAGLGDLCLRPPFIESYQRISERYGYLADHLRPIAVAKIKALEGGQPSQTLIRLLMAIERAKERAIGDKDEPPLAGLVAANPHVNRSLLWADVAEARTHLEASERPLTAYWQVYFSGGELLWGVREADLEWLLDDVANRAEIDDRRVALSIVVTVLRDVGRIDAERARLERLVAGYPELTADLAGYYAPRIESEREREYRLNSQERKQQHAQKEAENKASWVEFRAALQANPAQLSAPENLVSWQAGVFRLKHLTHWLMRRTGLSSEKAPREWRLLEEGFDRPVAEAYRDGMRMLWRHVKPGRPQRETGGQVNRQWMNILAFASVGVDAAETPDWPQGLNDAEAALVARHACLAEERCPDWMDRLILAHPQIVVALIGKELAREWATDQQFHTDFLYHFGLREVVLTEPLQDQLVKVFLRSEAGRFETLERVISIIPKLELDDARRARLWKAFHSRFETHVASGNELFAMRNLAALLLVRPDEALAVLATWIGGDNPGPSVTRAARVFEALFDAHHHGFGVPALGHATVPALEGLVRLVYRHIRPQDDVYHGGTYSPDTRDNAATARNTILSGLLDRPGADSYWTVRHLAEEPEFALRMERFRELAHAKAEKDSEPPAWSAAEVREFERSYTAPVKTGADLMRVALGVFGDINFQLAKGDMSSRSVLERAQDEEEVQNWLGEQLLLRARGRFHVYREAEVALGDMPDIVLASTTAPCEVAIEIKHGGKNWSYRKLEDALRSQLAENYLKPVTRRQGILVITNHRKRGWDDPETGKRLDFGALVLALCIAAKEITRNTSGAIAVACIGIDATDPQGHRP